MAKKKNRVAKKKAAPAKKKKAAKKKTSTRKSSSSNRSKPPGKSTSSVDSLLKKFALERTRKETLLSSLRKKKSECEVKLRKQQEQISKMTTDEKTLETELTQLDQQRDVEVKELLEKLGVQLGSPRQQSSQPTMQPRDHQHPNNRVASNRPVSTTGANGRNEN